MTGPAELRLAFFISSYGSGVQLARLVTTLRRSDPGCQVVIHHDSGGQVLDRTLFANDDRVHILVGEEPIVWGDMTLEAARWRVFRWILANLDVDWVMMLSEQDYPVAPVSRLHDRIASSDVDAFISAKQIDLIEDDTDRLEFEKRYWHRYILLPSFGIERRLPARLAALTKRARRAFFAHALDFQSTFRFYAASADLNLPTRLGVRVGPRPVGRDFPIWVNECWFALSRTAMQHVIAYVDTHPEFTRHFARTVIPLESATASILLNDQELAVENVSLHQIRWTDPASGRPDVFSLDDVDALTSSGALFARKFSLADTGVFDALDSVVLATSKESL